MIVHVLTLTDVGDDHTEVIGVYASRQGAERAARSRAARADWSDRFELCGTPVALDASPTDRGGDSSLLIDGDEPPSPRLSMWCWSEALSP